MKVMTVLGTRPEVIRLSLIIQKLDRLAQRHVLVHTGQNYTPSLHKVFFAELGLRAPDYQLQGGAVSFGRQLAALFTEVEQLLLLEKPDVLLLLGDTTSALCALLAARLGIPCLHMEAGNRCYDLTVPEEINRRAIDAVATVNMPYTPGSRDNLLREGFPVQRIVMTGNPIYEVLTYYKVQIAASDVLSRLGLKAGGYGLVTLHRAENVDQPQRLSALLEGLGRVAERFALPLICSVHPRTRQRLLALAGVSAGDSYLDGLGSGAGLHPLLHLHEPFGFFDFVRLEQGASCVFTDSGTVQEECCIFGVPTVTLRRSTERPETVDCGSNVVCGLEPERIVEAAKVMLGEGRGWTPPAGYLTTDVSDIVVKYVLGGNWHVY